MTLYPIEYYHFFVHFNEGDYYTCHDLLEEMWMVDKQNFFIKGLLQMSVAIYHYEYGNIKGARSMMETAKRYLSGYLPKFWGLNLEEVMVFIEKSLIIIPQNVDKVPFEEVHTLPDLPPLILYLEEDE